MFLLSNISYITYTTFKGVIELPIDKTKNTQILVTFPNETVEQIENFQFDNRIKNRNEAIRQLVEKGLQKSSEKE